MSSLDNDTAEWIAACARDRRLSPDDLRTVLAYLACYSRERGTRDVSVAELGRVVDIVPASLRRAFGTPALARYLRLSGQGETVERVQTETSHSTKPAASPRLGPGILGFVPDIERLKRAGDRLERQLTPNGKTTGEAPDQGTSEWLKKWNPVDGESTRPSSLRFRVWLQFVLSPDELALCKTWERQHPDAWARWARRFEMAAATGRDPDLLDDLRCQLDETGTPPDTRP